MVALTALYWQFALYAAPVLAKASGEDPTTNAAKRVKNGTNLVYTILAAGVAGVGVIYLLSAILDIGTAWASGHSTELSSSLKKLAGGIIITAAGSIVVALTT